MTGKRKPPGLLPGGWPCDRHVKWTKRACRSILISFYNRPWGAAMGAKGHSICPTRKSGAR